MRTEDGKGRKAAIEILLNTPTIAERIFKGAFGEIKALMERSRELGMRTFDWALFELYSDGHISWEEAMRNADSANELRLNMKLKKQTRRARVRSHRPYPVHRQGTLTRRDGKNPRCGNVEAAAKTPRS